MLQCASRYDGDLVAKCYYAKRKLVWEVLESSLKSKMEVQWSDISGIRASFPEDQPAVLDIEVICVPCMHVCVFVHANIYSCLFLVVHMLRASYVHSPLCSCQDLPYSFEK